MADFYFRTFGPSPRSNFIDQLCSKFISDIVLRYDRLFDNYLRALSINANSEDSETRDNTWDYMHRLSALFCQDTKINLSVTPFKFSPPPTIQPAIANLVNRMTLIVRDESLEPEKSKETFELFPKLSEIVISNSQQYSAADVFPVKNLKKLTVDEIQPSDFDIYKGRKAPYFPFVEALNLLNQEVEEIHEIRTLSAFICTHYTNLSRFSIFMRYISGFQIDATDLNFDLPASCKTVNIDFEMLKCFLKLEHLKHLQIVSSRDDENDTLAYYVLTEADLAKLADSLCQSQFRLDTFVLLCNMRLKLTAFLDVAVLKVLQFQPELKFLSLVFTFGSFDVDWPVVADWVEKNKNSLCSHPNIKFVRLCGKYLVLKDSITSEEVKWMDELDDDPDAGWDLIYDPHEHWNIRSSLPLEPSAFTLPLEPCMNRRKSLTKTDWHICKAIELLTFSR